MRRGSGLPAAAAFAAAVLVLAGCNKKLGLPQVGNQRPVASLTQAPVGGDNRYLYSYELRWSGFDPDGRVDHFEYAVDPPAAASAETAWVATTANRKVLTFRSGDPDSLGTKLHPGGFHVFVIRAVDNKGLTSEPIVRAFFSYTVAPDVRILNPLPNHLLIPKLPPSVVVTWTGHDVDGVHGIRPVKYKYKLFKEGASEFDVLTMALYPDSLRRYYAPEFAGWDSTITDTFARVTDLIPQSKYVFVVVAFDEAGAYSPVFSFDINMLYFTVGYPITGGPVLTIYNDQFNYTYPFGGYFNDPAWTLFHEIPSGVPVTLYWSAKPAEYTTVKQFRWALDIARLDDETPRSGPGDLRHWSYPALSNTQATVGPFTGSRDTTHFFYIEAEDNNGLKSLGIVGLRVVVPTFEKELLFVNDTRYELDRWLTPDTLLTALGVWPCAAELDTFLFARGGVRWQYYPNGALSRPGIFLGYHYDTLKTRRLPYNIVPLATLVRYRRIVWMTNNAPEVGVLSPSLWNMSTSGHSNTLATYIRMGGIVWLLGGGVARGTLLPWDSRSNNLSGMVAGPALNELVPGRFMYDLPRWQSEITMTSSLTAARNAALPPAGAGVPDYSGLPAQLLQRNVTNDPLPPLRGYEFYTVGYDAEFLSQPNEVTEEVAVGPDSTIAVSVLDTLYFTIGNIGGVRPVMTYYRGREGAPILFSGFPLWYFTRPQAMALGDWVLRGLWGLPRDPVSRDWSAAAPAASALRPRRP